MRLSLCVFVCIARAVYSENILGLFPTTAKSAFLTSEAIMKGLAARGHNVTVVSCFPQKTPIQNYTDISIRDTREMLESSIDIRKHDFPYSLVDLTSFFVDLIESMGNLLKSQQLKDLLSSDIKFDVVFHEMFVDNVFLMVAKKFNAPIIAVGPSYILPWAADRFGIPQNPSYIPTIGNSYGRQMSFYERLCNTVSNIRSTLDYWYVLVPKSIMVYERCFQEPCPPVKEAARSVSMYFVNTHFSFYGARPYPPQVVEIGGIHVQPVQKLPEELAQWMDKSVFGVVYFSFGSMLRGATLPSDKVKAFVEVFRQLPQQVLWKWEDDAVEGLSKNVKIMKWLPQRDVLAHPKVRLFISHGGLLGATEAVASSVPVLGIPTNMDQANNIAALVDNGVAMHLGYNNITVETLFYAIHHMLHDSSYSRNAKQLSRKFLDRPQSPLETAVYWTEYVIRHRGAPHLQSAAVHLTWYQYYLLDVAAFILAAFLAGMTIIYYVIIACHRLMFSKKFDKLKQI